MTITILGTGYVGLTSAALFAAAGFKTYIVDINPNRLRAVEEGRSFFFEEGLDSLIKAGIDNKRLLPTASYKDSVAHSDVVFSCVGTPDNPDGSSNLSYVFSAAEEAAMHMRNEARFVQKSTVPVGTGEHIRQLFAKSGKTIHYVSNPEFLREGTALRDSLWFDRIVVGGDDHSANQSVLAVYKQVEQKRGAIATLAGIAPPDTADEGRYISTSLNSAELIKVSANAFLAMKISFANSIAKLADAADADINEVMDAVGADSRIGRAFLNAGRGYGGGCFPKDVSGLISSGMKHGVDLEIMQAVESINSSMPGYIAEKLHVALGGTYTNKRIAVLGLAFKAGTSDTRRSPGIALANDLAKRGASVCVYDPAAMAEARPELRKGVSEQTSIEHAIDGCEAVLVATDWPAFIDKPLEDYAKRLANGKILVDCMNKFNPREVQSAGMLYIGVGRS